MNEQIERAQAKLYKASEKYETKLKNFGERMEAKFEQKMEENKVREKIDGFFKKVTGKFKKNKEPAAAAEEAPATSGYTPGDAPTNPYDK